MEEIKHTSVDDKLGDVWRANGAWWALSIYLKAPIPFDTWYDAVQFLYTVWGPIRDSLRQSQLPSLSIYFECSNMGDVLREKIRTGYGLKYRPRNDNQYLWEASNDAL